MPQFVKNKERLDPYKNFKFRVFFEGDKKEAVAGVSKVSGLKRKTEVVSHRDGGDMSSSRKSPGRTEYEAVTLERGVTWDLEFETWANQVWNYDNAQAGQNNKQSEVGLKNFRRDVRIELQNESGQAVLQYKLFRCWVSEYNALPELDANANAVAIQSIKIENEGWVRLEAPAETEEPEIK